MEKKKTNNDSPSNFENAFTKLGFDQPEQIASATNLDNEILDKEDVSDINAIEDPVKTTEDLKEMIELKMKLQKVLMMMILRSPKKY